MLLIFGVKSHASTKEAQAPLEGMMSTADEHLMMSVDGYLALDEASLGIRYEYLDGYARLRDGDEVKLPLNEVNVGAHPTKSVGSLNRSLISSNMNVFLGQALRDAPCFVFNTDVRVKLSDTNYVYPDVTVSCAAWPDNSYALDEPTVVVVVLSPGTAAANRTEKLRRYRECPAVQAILLVEQDQPLVEVNQRQSANNWATQTYTMDEQIVLGAIGVTLPVAEIYRRLAFTS